MIYLFYLSYIFCFCFANYFLIFVIVPINFFLLYFSFIPLKLILCLYISFLYPFQISFVSLLFSISFLLYRLFISSLISLYLFVFPLCSQYVAAKNTVFLAFSQLRRPKTYFVFFCFCVFAIRISKNIYFYRFLTKGDRNPKLTKNRLGESSLGPPLFCNPKDYVW